MTPSKKLPDIDYLNECFCLDGGDLIWKVRPAHHFKTSGVMTWWNRNFPGKKAGGMGSKGYLQIGLFRKKFLNHRVVFFMHNGEQPEYVDHIDEDKLNNKPTNLRAASLHQNMQNKGTPKSNSSGIKGVVWNKLSKKWQAQCVVNKITKYGGIFSDIADAEIAVKALRSTLHGEFANNGVSQ